MIKKVGLFVMGLTVVLALALAAWGYFGQKRVVHTAQEEALHAALCGYMGTDDVLKGILASKPNLNVT